MTLPSSGKYFSHVLNTTASPLERLLMQREIHSPCWIDVHNVLAGLFNSVISHCFSMINFWQIFWRQALKQIDERLNLVSPDSHISYCRFEYVVDMSKNIQNISMDNNSPDSIPNVFTIYFVPVLPTIF